MAQPQLFNLCHKLCVHVSAFTWLAFVLTQLIQLHRGENAADAAMFLTSAALILFASQGI